MEKYKTSYEKTLTDHDLPVGYGIIPAGTVGAVNRMGADVAPEWEFAPGMVYRSALNLNCDFSANDQA